MMNMALSKVVFLPYAYQLERWRWDFFAGKATTENLNAHYWKLRESIQGLKAPVPRTEADLDPVAKYHVANHVSYIRYFVSHIIQFQFYEALCKAAEEYEPGNPEKPLHRCDFYKNEKAGKIFREALSMGSSKPWPDVMQKITGQRRMSAAPLRTYFAPLEKYLDDYFQENGVCVGWGGE